MPDELAALRLKADLLRGTIVAQDERERLAGARCGLPYEHHGCDWPEWVADEVLALRAERDNALAELAQAKRKLAWAREYRIQLPDGQWIRVETTYAVDGPAWLADRDWESLLCTDGEWRPHGCGDVACWPSLGALWAELERQGLLPQPEVTNADA